MDTSAPATPATITEDSELIADDKIIKVKQKLAHSNVNVGTEGTADFYLCEIYNADGDMIAESILCIFIALHEEFTCKLISKDPTQYTDATDAINKMLALVEKYYLEFSKREKECLTTRLH